MKFAFLAALSLGFTALASHASPENAILDAYDTVGLALAGDDLTAAKTSAATLATVAATSQPAMTKTATKMAQSISLEVAREDFKKISLDAVKLASGLKGYYVVTCPMASADWVQKTTEVHNPYMGKAMLNCGVLKTSSE